MLAIFYIIGAMLSVGLAAIECWPAVTVCVAVTVVLLFARELRALRHRHRTRCRLRRTAAAS